MGDTKTLVKLDKLALAEAVRKTAKLRVEDVGGRKERPAETVQSCLNRGFAGLGSPEGLGYILRHAVKYYLGAVTASHEARIAELEEALRPMLQRFELYAGPDDIHAGEHDKALLTLARRALHTEGE